MYLKIYLRDDEHNTRHTRVTPWSEFEKVLEEIEEELAPEILMVTRNDNEYEAKILHEGEITGYVTAHMISEQQYLKEKADLEAENAAYENYKGKKMLEQELEKTIVTEQYTIARHNASWLIVKVTRLSDQVEFFFDPKESELAEDFILDLACSIETSLRVVDRTCYFYLSKMEESWMKIDGQMWKNLDHFCDHQQMDAQEYFEMLVRNPHLLNPGNVQRGIEMMTFERYQLDPPLSTTEEILADMSPEEQREILVETDDGFKGTGEEYMRRHNNQ